MHLFNRNSQALCSRLSNVAEQTIDIHDYFSESTVDVLLGKEPNIQFVLPRSFSLQCIISILWWNHSIGQNRKKMDKTNNCTASYS